MTEILTDPGAAALVTLALTVAVWRLTERSPRD